MEKRMEECAGEIMQQDPSVRGVLCTDCNGALLYACGSLAPAGDNNGTAAAHSAAVASQLANLACALEPGAQPLALVLSCSAGRSSPMSSSSLSTTASNRSQQSATLQSPTTAGTTKVLIKRNGPVTVAVHK